MPSPSRRPRTVAFRPAVALAEVLIATTITAASAGALLTAIGSSTRVAESSLHREIAGGLAAELMFELHGVPFRSDVPPNPHCGYGYGREAFCTLDSLDGWSARPPQNECGIPVSVATDRSCANFGSQAMTRTSSRQANGSLMNRFRRAIEVEPIEQTAAGWVATTAPTRFRRVTVAVDYFDAAGNAIPLASIEEIFVDAAP